MTNIVNGYGQARLVFTVFGRLNQVITTVGYKINDSASPTDSAAEIDGFFKGATRLIAATHMADSWQYLGVDVTENRGLGPIQSSYRAEVDGGASFAPPPSNCAVVVKKVTARGGRKGRGRFFLPPAFLAESDVDQVGRFVKDVIQGRVSASMDAWRAGAHTKPFLLHADATVPDAIIGDVVEGVIGTQRRRMR